METALWKSLFPPCQSPSKLATGERLQITADSLTSCLLWISSVLCKEKVPPSCEDVCGDVLLLACFLSHGRLGMEEREEWRRSLDIFTHGCLLIEEWIGGESLLWCESSCLSFSPGLGWSH